ncbi:glycosyltransferase [Pseudomonas sp. FW306-02-F02-AA]|uniref:Glycosyltransferase 2-like domain-containing protein n=1 Tax=Pseudomonas fluorescens TaxID=294 RepID=A0A0N9VPK5_PSEFL|nr:MULTISPECIES: glycosyltransferase family 2 protein [Pseudomonas]ALH99878.1 hypothetical protein AO353_02020 [Pseudomonas fluorescens]PMZ03144.1 glycosyltransferase [Pseudomonas sp. FW306-02-F02-AB]PMZ08979.1 glycosyltransferase [Pseudomonas sp. FW306-02-H06C]PMZ14360.1 glycosyltransferase [Pseudomonas sp. FW306-02-F02-AA]PMZ19856.1 glycosyltransferase [Pseudomonas sp. FW306-02-F08-AA]
MPDFLSIADSGDDNQVVGRVAILLSTYNGEKYLAAQLESLISQEYQNWEIHASDDGSSDGTLEILERYRESLGASRLSIYRGPGRGFAANFMSLVRREGIQASYFAFCDQDDIWAKEKISSAVRCLEEGGLVPALYCSRTRLVDESGVEMGYSALFSGQPCFENALVQSIAGGNTMVLNASARKLLSRTPVALSIVSHDWWAYLLVSGSGGKVYYDPTPQVDYRQHDNNLMGSNRRLSERLLRLKKMFDGTFRAWSTANLAALEHFRQELTGKHLERVDMFHMARSSALPMRLVCFKRAGIYRQSAAENVVLIAAALINRL